MRNLLLFLGILLVSPTVIGAENEFSTKYVVRHRYDASGTSTIEQRISLTNNVSQVYASQYQLTIQGEAPENITGSDAKGPLAITTTRQGSDTTLITVVFNDFVVGKGNTLEFTLNYSGSNAVHNGQVWEIILPKLGNPSFINEYELHLQTPEEFGKLAYISPQPRSSSGNTYVFTKDQLTKTGVVAAFGNFQAFGFNLKYQIENPQDKPVYTEIALPADTNYQRVFFDSIVPAPVSVRIDDDGNWLARYDLEPLEKREVVATGQAHLLVEPSQVLGVATTAPLNEYLKPTTYWPTNDPKIRELAAKLKTPEAIYNYVVSTLSYNYDLAKPGKTRAGAVGALEKPTDSVCTEFTDLFIAIARAAGIPAREVNGYAYTTDASLRPLSLISDVLHAWPQYWDEKRAMWISIDPTWGNTTGGIDYFNKLDFSHFAFVTHGLSDTMPIAAGLYKADPMVKNISVDFVQYQEYPSQPLQVAWTPSQQVLPFKTTTSAIKISNPQGQAVYRTEINVAPINIKISSQDLYQITAIPPYGQVDLPVDIAPGPWFNFNPKALDVFVGPTKMTYTLGAKYYLLWQISVGFTLSSIVIILAILAGRSWGVHLQRRGQAHIVRGQGQEPPQ